MNRGYLRRGPGARKRRGERKHVSEYPKGELNFEKPSDEVNDEYPPRSGEAAGGLDGAARAPSRRAVSLDFAGETRERRDAGDDLEPADTLIDRDGSGSRGDPMAHIAEDARMDLSVAPGLGGGRDEAEDAEAAPVGEREARRMKRIIRKHAHDAQAFEPHEQAEVAERRAAARREQRHGQ